MSPSILQLNDPALNLQIPESTWRAALATATSDPSVGIRHAALNGTPDWRVHVAAIPEKVGCHFHQQGDEVYQVVEGAGLLHYGPVSDEDQQVKWAPPLPVSAGDTFCIPAGDAHQLQRQGNGSLTILFACPDTHLADDLDRHLLPDAPNLR